jgi:hypothetical protein
METDLRGMKLVNLSSNEHRGMVQYCVSKRVRLCRESRPTVVGPTGRVRELQTV